MDDQDYEGMETHRPGCELLALSGMSSGSRFQIKPDDMNVHLCVIECQREKKVKLIPLKNAQP
jgi:hypothetical protein